MDVKISEFVRSLKKALTLLAESDKDLERVLSKLLYTEGPIVFSDLSERLKNLSEEEKEMIFLLHRQGLIVLD